MFLARALDTVTLHDPLIRGSFYHHDRRRLSRRAGKYFSCQFCAVFYYCFNCIIIRLAQHFLLHRHDTYIFFNGYMQFLKCVNVHESLEQITLSPTYTYDAHGRKHGILHELIKSTTSSNYHHCPETRQNNRRPRSRPVENHFEPPLELFGNARPSITEPKHQPLHSGNAFCRTHDGMRATASSRITPRARAARHRITRALINASARRTLLACQ